MKNWADIPLELITIFLYGSPHRATAFLTNDVLALIDKLEYVPIPTQLLQIHFDVLTAHDGFEAPDLMVSDEMFERIFSKPKRAGSNVVIDGVDLADKRVMAILLTAHVTHIQAVPLAPRR